MNNSHNKTLKRKRRHAKVRAKISGTSEKPRLSVFRSNKSIYAQIINDETGETLVSATDVKESKGTKIEKAAKIGKLIAESAKAKKITKVVFDRGGYLFAGRVKALAEAAREAGLEF
jgi:large subunit ribosomal protein L18